MRLTRNHHDVGVSSAKLPMTAMIDVVFMMLMYFLLSATLSDPESDLASALRAEQESGSGSAADFQPQIVEVLQREGKTVYRVGLRELLDADRLEELLRTLPQEPGIFVQVSGDVPVLSAAAALQACKNAGFIRVSYVPTE
jgi:biopolymer transport protein ExbD